MWRCVPASTLCLSGSSLSSSQKRMQVATPASRHRPGKGPPNIALGSRAVERLLAQRLGSQRSQVRCAWPGERGCRAAGTGERGASVRGLLCLGVANAPAVLDACARQALGQRERCSSDRSGGEGAQRRDGRGKRGVAGIALSSAGAAAARRGRTPRRRHAFAAEQRGAASRRRSTCRKGGETRWW
jgi:hypothetical protein